MTITPLEENRDVPSLLDYGQIAVQGRAQDANIPAPLLDTDRTFDLAEATALFGNSTDGATVDYADAAAAVYFYR